MEYYNIAFVGSGHLAWHLAPELENIGHKVSMVHSRTKKNAYRLIDRLYSASYKKGLDFSRSDIDVVIIAVNDQHIPDISEEIILPDHCCIFHTSGTESMKTLEKSAAEHYGVLYPLQSFTKGIKTNFREVPVCIEGNDEYAYKVLHALTRGITKYIYKIEGTQRSIIHLSAVIAANFSNHMLTLAKNVMDAHDMNYELLYQVVHSTIEKAFEAGPEHGQTGPAIRGDQSTIAKHLKLLKNDPEVQKIYKMISNHIMKIHH